MTFKYNNVFINDTYTIVGPLENKGPLSNYFDKHYDDYYFKCKNFDEAEASILRESILKLDKSDLIISGDLQNQIAASSFGVKDLNTPYLGVFSACATSVESLIIASNMIEKNQIKNCICSTSSHNNTAEKQFRFPIEYGGFKPKTTTYTVTGAASVFLSRKKSDIKVESSTIGKVIDMNIKDAYKMGAVMAPAFIDTLNTHLKDLNRKPEYYDLILSGDLGIYGKEIINDILKLKNYDDTACMIYDKNQNVYSGGSGPVCAPLVLYSYIFNLMRNNKLKKVLLIATGSLHNQVSVNEKRSIPSIAHAISLEKYDIN